jgi:formylmethanofuran dehydrogenase subunit D
VLHLVGQQYWDTVLESTVDQFWRLDEEEFEGPVSRLQPTAGAAIEKRRTVVQRKKDIMSAAQTAADLAKKEESSTNALVDVLEEKIRNLAVKEGESLGVGPVVGNPPVTAKKQNQARNQGSVPFAPMTKGNNKLGKAQAKDKKVKKKAGSAQSRGTNWMK